MNRLSKESAVLFAKKWTALYVGIFRELQKEGGRVQIESRFSQIRQNLGSYVRLYEDENRLGMATLIGLYGEAGVEEMNRSSETWTESEKAVFLEDLASDDYETEIDAILNLPRTDEEWTNQANQLQLLPEAERHDLTRRGAFLFSGVFAQVFNTLALMTHGAKLTSLVPLAIQGDPEAFLKAVQVDRFLLSHHPYFVQRKQQAQDNGEDEFLRALAYRESNPNLKGKIRYPGLFMLFGLLESIRWLDDLKHNEILDLCDEIGLDRFQNRIEDVNYLTKRLLDYRRFQKSGGLSMH